MRGKDEEKKRVHKLKDKIISIVNKAAVFFFGVLVFFLPISGATIETCFGFILLCFLIRFAIERPSGKDIRAFFNNRVNLALLIFYLCIGFSFFSSGDLLGKSLRAWVSKWGEGVALFYLAQIFLNKQKVKYLIYVFLASAFLVSVDGIYQYIVGIDFLRGFELKGANDFLGVTASFSHFNNFSTYLSVIFLLSCSVLLRIKKSWVRFGVYVLFLLLVINIFLVNSRAGLLSLSIGLIVFAFLFPGRRIKFGFLFFLLICLVAGISIPFLRENILELIERADGGRFGIWKGAVLMFKDYPLNGRGLGLFMNHITDYGLQPLYAHNCYLQILAETGLLGFVSFLWFLGLVFGRSIKMIIKKFDILLLGTISASSAFCVQMFFDTQLYSLKLSILFWLLISFVAIFVSCTDLQKEGE